MKTGKTLAYLVSSISILGGHSSLASDPADAWKIIPVALAGLDSVGNSSSGNRNCATGTIVSSGQYSTAPTYIVSKGRNSTGSMEVRLSALFPRETRTLIQAVRGDSNNFKRRCGNQYVSSVMYGSELSIAYIAYVSDISTKFPTTPEPQRPYDEYASVVITPSFRDEDTASAIAKQIAFTQRRLVETAKNSGVQLAWGGVSYEHGGMPAPEGFFGMSIEEFVKHAQELNRTAGTNFPIAFRLKDYPKP